MSTATPAVSVAPPTLRVATFADYEAIHALETAHLRERQPEDDWRRFWVDNPLWPRVGSRWPVGWVLEAADSRLVGTMTNVPSLYRFRGRELLCANGRAWVVLPEYRGFALWPMSEYFNQPGVDLFINTTVGPLAVPAVASFSVPIPRGEWDTAAYFATNYHDLARRGLEKAGWPQTSLLAGPLAGALWLKDALFAPRLRAAPPGYTIEATPGFDGRFDAFWEELLRLRPDTLLGVRDSRALAWHYARPLRRGRLWIYTASRGGLLRAFAVVKRQDLGEGLRRLRLVDFQTLEPDADLLPGLLRPVLRRAAAEGYAVVEHLGTGLPRTASFDRCAPYRRKFPNWQFYFQAADALRAELAAPDVWDPSAYDGDASFE